jgi:signal peptidase I
VKTNYYRFVFWPLWFVVVPLGLALLTLWALVPADGDFSAGAIRVWVGEQKVPAVIVLFTLYELVLHHFRHVLPLAGHLGKKGGSALSSEMRRKYEHASQLIDESERILRKNKRAIGNALPAEQVDEIRAAIDDVRQLLNRDPLDQERFQNEYERLNDLVLSRLGRWQRGELRQYSESILIAVGAALLLRAFVIEAFKIPSGSMLPTLQVHDHIFVNKFAYGPTVPFTGKRLYDGLPPKRGDVMVFEFPDPNSRVARQDFIKRAVALPGDTLLVKNGHPVINGWKVPHCFVGRYQGARLYLEYLSDYSYLTTYDSFFDDNGAVEGPYHVADGEVWVLGDNRSNSHDSRAWNDGRGGGVPFANIKGRAMFVWLSFQDGGSPWDITWGRLFTNVLGTPRLPNEPPPALQQQLQKCLSERPEITNAPDPN